MTFFKGAIWLLPFLQGIRATNLDGQGRVTVLTTAITVPPDSTPVIEFTAFRSGSQSPSPFSITTSSISSLLQPGFHKENLTTTITIPPGSRPVVHFSPLAGPPPPATTTPGDVLSSSHPDSGEGSPGSWTPNNPGSQPASTQSVNPPPGDKQTSISPASPPPASESIGGPSHQASSLGTGEFSSESSPGRDGFWTPSNPSTQPSPTASILPPSATTAPVNVPASTDPNPGGDGSQTPSSPGSQSAQTENIHPSPTTAAPAYVPASSNPSHGEDGFWTPDNPSTQPSPTASIPPPSATTAPVNVPASSEPVPGEDGSWTPSSPGIHSTPTQSITPFPGNPQTSAPPASPPPASSTPSVPAGSIPLSSTGAPSPRSPDGHGSPSVLTQPSTSNGPAGPSSPSENTESSSDAPTISSNPQSPTVPVSEASDAPISAGRSSQASNDHESPSVPTPSSTSGGPGVLPPLSGSRSTSAQVPTSSVDHPSAPTPASQTPGSPASSPSPSGSRGPSSQISESNRSFSISSPSKVLSSPGGHTSPAGQTITPSPGSMATSSGTQNVSGHSSSSSPTDEPQLTPGTNSPTHTSISSSSTDILGSTKTPGQETTKSNTSDLPASKTTPNSVSVDPSSLSGSSSELPAAISEYAPTGTPSEVPWGTLTAAPATSSSGSTDDQAPVIAAYVRKLWDNKSQFKKEESRKGYKDHIDDDIRPRIDDYIKTKKIDESKSSCSGSVRRRDLLSGLGSAVKGAADTASKIGKSTINEAKSAVGDAISDLVPCIKTGLNKISGELSDTSGNLPDGKIETIESWVDGVTEAASAWEDVEEKLKEKEDDDDKKSTDSESQSSTTSSTSSCSMFTFSNCADSIKYGVDTASSTAWTSTTVHCSSTSACTSAPTTITTKTIQTIGGSCVPTTGSKTTRSWSSGAIITLTPTSSVKLDTWAPLSDVVTGTSTSMFAEYDNPSGKTTGTPSGSPKSASPSQSPSSPSPKSTSSASDPPKLSPSASSSSTSTASVSRTSTTSSSSSSTSSSESATPTAGVYIAYLSQADSFSGQWKAFGVDSGDADEDPDYCKLKPDDTWTASDKIKVGDVPFPDKHHFDEDTKLPGCVYAPHDDSAGVFACVTLNTDCTTDFKGYGKIHECNNDIFVPKVLCQLSADSKEYDG